jgi:hypothetical protein
LKQEIRGILEERGKSTAYRQTPRGTRLFSTLRMYELERQSACLGLNCSKILPSPYSSSRGFVQEVDDDEIPGIFFERSDSSAHTYAEGGDDE